MKRLFRLLTLASVFVGSPMALAQDAPQTAAADKESEAKAEKGKPAPDFTMTGIDGKQFKLSDRLGKDKYIIIMFSRANW